MYRDSETGPAITPQLALRVAILGGIALVAFGVIFIRLWYLQILSGDTYLAKARDNQVREIRVDAPRGKIVDRDGRVLVDNRIAYAVKVSPDKLPRRQADKTRLYVRLARVLGMRRNEIRATVRTQLKAQPFAKATVKLDATQPQYAYILEHWNSFPGVEVEPVALRYYPHHSIGAHLFGTVGEVTAEELKDKTRYRGVAMGDRVGQSGIEYAYDRYLRGQDGAERVQVDSLGNFRGTLAERPAKPGQQLRLSIDYDVQRVGQDALAGSRGAFVVMDIKNGEIRALGSSPSFDPNVFSKGVKESVYSALLHNPDNPLANRAIQGLYPTGSTFKPITSVAALESGVLTPSTPIYDPGYFDLGGGLRIWNAGHVANGTLTLVDALKVSSDVFFYKVGAELNNAAGGEQLQHWARQLGIGRKTGIELPGEVPGLLPTPEWRDRLFKKHATDKSWTIGDNVNLAVGQGDLQADPLQMAVAYAAIANGGYIVRPHLGERIEDRYGRVIQELGNNTARRRVPISSQTRSLILQGLYEAANAPGGTSTDVFKDFPIKVAGKTGTAERGPGRPDQSWYVALAPWPNPRYVVAVTDETGGFGAETAAPDARRILAALFGIKSEENKIVKGASRTR